MYQSDERHSDPLVDSSIVEILNLNSLSNDKPRDFDHLES